MHLLGRESHGEGLVGDRSRQVGTGLSSIPTYVTKIYEWYSNLFPDYIVSKTEAIDFTISEFSDSRRRNGQTVWGRKGLLEYVMKALCDMDV